jgi:hypothetical protein
VLTNELKNKGIAKASFHREFPIKSGFRVFRDGFHLNPQRILSRLNPSRGYCFFVLFLLFLLAYDRLGLNPFL